MQYGQFDREMRIDMTSKTPPHTRKYWSEDDSICELCGREFKDRIVEAEMMDPDSDDQSYVVHEKCGLRMGWVDAR